MNSTKNFIHLWLGQFNLSENTTDILAVAIACLIVLAAATTITMVLRTLFLPTILKWIRNNNYRWDDILEQRGFLQKASWLIPVMIIGLSIDTLLDPNSSTYILIKRMTLTGYVIVATLTLTSLLDAINDIHKLLRKNRRHYLQAYVDAGKIIIYVLGVIFIVSIFTGRSPWGIISILGGLTAVTMLIFKDSILGFVASIQLTATDMVQVGDWIEMDQYGADGDVISMTIHSIRIQNWDKTITTIPTHALVSSSFKNWRGMSESGGRRIKRSLFIDMDSIKFCDEEMLAKFRKIDLLKEYLAIKESEIGQVDDNSINNRHQTNIGIFRAYVAAYLKNNPKIHKSMTFLVRQLQPGNNGLPLEIYVFSNDQVWANYEAIQADIFDHLLAALPEFDLRIFQNPTGYDMRHMGERNI